MDNVRCINSDVRKLSSSIDTVYKFDFVMNDNALIVNGDGAAGTRFDYSVFIGRVFKGDKGDGFTWDDVTVEQKTEMAEGIVKPLLKDLVFKGLPVDLHVKSIDATIPERVAELERRMGDSESLNLIKIAVADLDQKVADNSAVIRKVSEDLGAVASDHIKLEERVTVVEDKIETFVSTDDIDMIFS